MELRRSWSMNVSSVDPLTNFQVLKISAFVAFAGANYTLTFIDNVKFLFV